MNSGADEKPKADPEGGVTQLITLIIYRNYSMQ